MVSALSSLAASADRALRTTDGTGSSWLAANEQVLALVRAAGPELPESQALARAMARPTPLADRLALVAEVDRASTLRVSVTIEIPAAALADFRRVFGDLTAESFARLLDHTPLLGAQVPDLQETAS